MATNIDSRDVNSRRKVIWGNRRKVIWGRGRIVWGMTAVLMMASTFASAQEPQAAPLTTAARFRLAAAAEGRFADFVSSVRDGTKNLSVMPAAADGGAWMPCR